MPIVEFSNLNKYGNLRTRRFYQEKSNFGINPKGLGHFITFKLFKYDYKYHIAPSLTNFNGKRYIVPTWQEVLPETTLNDINWIKPKVKKILESTTEVVSLLYPIEIPTMKKLNSVFGDDKQAKLNHLKEIAGKINHIEKQRIKPTIPQYQEIVKNDNESLGSGKTLSEEVFQVSLLGFNQWVCAFLILDDVNLSDVFVTI